MEAGRAPIPATQCGSALAHPPRAQDRRLLVEAAAPHMSTGRTQAGRWRACSTVEGSSLFGGPACSVGLHRHAAPDQIRPRQYGMPLPCEQNATPPPSLQASSEAARPREPQRLTPPPRALAPGGLPLTSQAKASGTAGPGAPLEGCFRH